MILQIGNLDKLKGMSSSGRDEEESDEVDEDGDEDDAYQGDRSHRYEERQTRQDIITSNLSSGRETLH